MEVPLLQAMSLKKQSKVNAENIPDVIYWYDRLLPLKEDTNGNYGISKQVIALSLNGRLLYYEPINDDIPNNDLSSAELEEVLDLKKQLVIVQPSELSYLSISTTFNQLGRWEEAISHSKKGIRAQFVRAGTSGGHFEILLSLYGGLIEAQVKNKCFEDAMGTFKKLKKFNLNSLNAQDVDVKTPISDVRKLINRIKAEPIHSEYFLENMNALEFEEDKKVIKIVTCLGNLCEWKSQIFQAFAGPEEPGWKGWKQMPPTIFAELGTNRNPLVKSWAPQDEATFRRLCMVNQEHQCNWLKVR